MQTSLLREQKITIFNALFSRITRAFGNAANEKDNYT